MDPAIICPSRLDCYFDQTRPPSSHTRHALPTHRQRDPGTWSGGSGADSHGSSSQAAILGRRDRIRPERGHNNRHPVQKMQWRRSRWVRGFHPGSSSGHHRDCPTPDYSDMDSRLCSMTIADVSPRLAAKKVLMLYERQQYKEAANFVNRLSHATFKVILPELPVDLLVDSVPASLPVLEALYAKVFLADGLSFGLRLLRPDVLVMRMVRMFAEGHDSSPPNSPTPPTHSPPPDPVSSCRKLLKVMLVSEPQLRKVVQHRRRALDKAIEGLGAHGLVGTSDESLIPLHEALRSQFRKVVEAYKGALAKLEEYALDSSSNRSIAHGPAPVQASHQRQLSLRQEEIQERLIRNKSLLNLLEPTLQNHSLAILLGILQRRVDNDKDALFQYTQIRKEAPASASTTVVSPSPGSNDVVAPLLMKYAQGCENVLRLMQEVAEDDQEGTSSDISGYHSDSDSAIMTSGNSPYVSKRARYNFLCRSLRSVGGQGRTPLPQHLLRPLPLSNVKEDNPGVIVAPALMVTSSASSGSDSPPVTATAKVTRLRHLKQKRELQKLNSAGSSSGSVSSVTNMSVCCSSVESELKAMRSQLDEMRALVAAAHERERRLMDRLEGKKPLSEMLLLTPTVPHTPHLPPPQPQATCQSGDVVVIVHANGGANSRELVSRYGELYARSRVDTLDALDALPQLCQAEELKSKLLFSVVVLAFRSAQGTLADIHSDLSRLLQIQAGSAPALLDAINAHLRSTASKFDLSKNVQDVCSQIWSTLYDYPCLRECEELVLYIKDCMRIAWELSNQCPPFVVEHERQAFQRDLHVRFHTSQFDSEHVKAYLWPALLEGVGGPCVYKAVVLT